MEKMECVGSKTQSSNCKISRKVTYLVATAICLSVTLLLVTVACATALLAMLSKHEAAIVQLESKVKKCERPFAMLNEISKLGNYNYIHKATS